jgi:hypothetical protein
MTLWAVTVSSVEVTRTGSIHRQIPVFYIQASNQWEANKIALGIVANSSHPAFSYDITIAPLREGI